MERYGFFNSVNGDRRYDSDFFAKYFASFIGNGIYPNPSTNLQVVSVNGNLSITIKPGKAFINGYLYENTEDLYKTIEPSDALLNRIDRVVLRWDRVNRNMAIHIIKGTPSSNPTSPSVRRDGDVYEIGLADIRVLRNQLTVVQSDVTDTRLNNSVCGLVHGAIDQVDTSTIFTQYVDWFVRTSDKAEIDISNIKTNLQQGFNTWWDNVKTVSNSHMVDLETFKTNVEAEFNTWWDSVKDASDVKIEELEAIKTTMQADFLTWWDGMKDVLDGDAAGNILNKIDAIPVIKTGVTQPTGARGNDFWFRVV